MEGKKPLPHALLPALGAFAPDNSTTYPGKSAFSEPNP